jgi:hypothetical protein
VQKFNEKNLPVARNIPIKTDDTTGTGHGVAAGVKFRDCTCTRMTRTCDTAGYFAVPVFFPTFVGIINFYRQFILDFSQHAHPLFDFTMKDVRFIWGSPQEDAFVILKGLVTSTPILALPDSDLPYRLEADASGVATGSVLSQQSGKDSKWHQVSFLSKVLSPVERNYETHNVEMLAII